MMITVTYKNEENGQEAVFTTTPIDNDSAKVKINFEPTLKENIDDPYGILEKLAYFFTVSTKGE